MDSEAEAATDVVRRAVDSVALVEVAEGLKNYLEREGAALPCGVRAE